MPRSQVSNPLSNSPLTAELTELAEGRAYIMFPKFRTGGSNVLRRQVYKIMYRNTKFWLILVFKNTIRSTYGRVII